MPFNISLTAELSEDNKTGITAHFYGIGDAPLEELTPRTLRGIIPCKFCYICGVMQLLNFRCSVRVKNL